MQVPSPTAFERHERRQVAASVLVLGLLAALIVPAATFAGKSGGSGVTPWIGLDGIVDDSGARLDVTDPNLGDWVTFSTVVPRNVNNPRIEVLCSQGGVLVYGAAGAVDEAFQLGGGSSPWKDAGGPAECRANLFYFSWKANTPSSTVLASTWFSAGG